MRFTPFKYALVSSAIFTASMVQAEEVKIPEWLNNISLSGAVEVELSKGETYAGANTSDIALATVAIGLDAKVNKRTDVRITLLHEDDDTENFVVDEGFITIADADKTPLYFSAGRLYVPFGHYDTNALSDPLTLDMGETQEAALMLGYEKNGVYASIYAFNGETNKAPATDNEAEQMGLNLGYVMETERMSMDVGMGYMSSISDSDGVSGSANMNNNASLTDYVAGMSIHLTYTRGAFNFFAEYLGATDKFAATELAFNGTGAEPSTYNIEVGYTFDMNGDESTAAVSVQGSDEALALGMPEQRYIAALSTAIMENTALAFELKHDVDYAVADGGTDNSADTITVQLALEF